MIVRVDGPGWSALLQVADAHGGPKAVARKLQLRGAAARVVAASGDAARVVVDACAGVKP